MPNKLKKNELHKNMNEQNNIKLILAVQVKVGWLVFTHVKCI